MHDTVPSAIRRGIRVSVLNLPNVFKKHQEQPSNEEQQVNTTATTTVKRKEKDIHNLMILGLSELMGTALLLFLGCMGCVNADIMPVPHYWSALTFGMSVMLIIQAFGHISGAHLNPAVTIATVILGTLKPSFAFVYIVGQFVGALIGFGVLKLLIPAEYTATEQFNPLTNSTEHKLGLCTTFVNPKVSVMQALALETIITAILVLVCCAVWDKRNVKNSDSVPLRFGFIIMVIASVAGPYTGASMNPPRSFAPAVYNNDWEHHWVYWIGPILGSFAGTFFYKLCFETPVDEENSKTMYLENSSLNEKNEVTSRV